MFNVYEIVLYPLSPYASGFHVAKTWCVGSEIFSDLAASELRVGLFWPLHWTLDPLTSERGEMHQELEEVFDV